MSMRLNEKLCNKIGFNVNICPNCLFTAFISLFNYLELAVSKCTKTLITKHIGKYTSLIRISDYKNAINHILITDLISDVSMELLFLLIA